MRAFLISALLLLLSYHASAWETTDDFRFVGSTALSVTTMTSLMNESDDVNATIIVSKIVEESTNFMQKVETYTRISSSHDLYGSAVRTDNTLTNGCEYCGSGKTTAYTDVSFSQQFGSPRVWSEPCQIWQEPDID